MYDESVRLMEMPEHDSVSLCVYIEEPELLALGERLNARFEEAYMNGYNWDALIKFYVSKADPDLMSAVHTDPEAGMFSAFMSHNPENLESMKQFESHVRKLLSDEQRLMTFIEQHYDEIEWD